MQLFVLLSICLDIVAVLLHIPRSHLKKARDGEEKSYTLQTASAYYLEASGWRL